MVAAVAALEPQVAANNADAPTFECISPPGSQPSQAVMESYILSARPDRSSTSPSMTNSGTLSRTKPLDDVQPTSARARLSGKFEYSASRVRPMIPSVAATGKAMASNTRSKTKAVRIMAFGLAICGQDHQVPGPVRRQSSPGRQCAQRCAYPVARAL